MNVLTIKILKGIFLTSASTTSVFLIQKYIDPKNIEEQLKWDGEIILDTSSEQNNLDERWWKKITKNWDSDEELSTFAGKDKTSRSEKIKALKSKCKDTLKTSKNASNFIDYLNKTKKYCVKRK